MTYSVCTAPNTTICDTAVLTVTAGAAPALTVMKSATPAVLVVGARVSVHDHDRSVANGPTTAAINVSDVCRQGDQRSDHGDGRDAWWLSGQWATSLAGCTVASGHQWPGGDHGTGGGGGECGEPTVNTATVTGGGDPTCTNCSGTTSRTR